jgi:2,5-furandicarboxylate decarboxylase 1
MGGIHYNPRVKINAVLHRRDPIYYALHMPWENIWMSAPIYEAAAWRVLGETGVKATAIYVTPGGCCHWHIIAAIRKLPGDGKNAIAALLSIADIKHVVVTDEDIDIFDPVEVEWAIATRVQADRDVVILTNARSKPLDPSLPPVKGVPTTAKMGIDATIPENVPRERYQRIVYLNEGKVRLEDYVDGKKSTQRGSKQKGGEGDVEALTEKILKALARDHRFFAELLDLFPDEGFGKIARAIGVLNDREKIGQDGEGKYQIKES